MLSTVRKALRTGTTLLALLVAPSLAHGQAPTQGLAWPEITREAKPWTRWWWHGSAVEEGELRDAMRAYRDAGLGGVEITPIYGVSGHEASFIEYLSSTWLDRLRFTLEEAQRLDLGVDMATGTGWPFGGPWIDAEHASKYVAYRSYELDGGERLGEPVAMRQEALVRAVGNQIYESYGPILSIEGQAAEGSVEKPLRRPGSEEIGIEQIVEPIAETPDLQSLALEQVRFPKPLPLQALMAYSDHGEVLDLTEHVDRHGRLDWTAPDEGRWRLYALFQGWHGKQVERAAPGGEGNVIDHFSRPSLQRYLDRFDQAFGERGIPSLRAFFNDSYEVDDASGQANWTPQLFSEFQRRRGYDLRRHLPALFGEYEPEANARVLSDFRETVSDLLLEEFTVPWRDWARSRDALVRNQAHGSPANILDLYAASGIPETEGTDLLRIKFASSAAHLTGKPVASAEAATWLGEHFTSTLAEVKTALDRFFVGGVNHVFYHGTTYSPSAEPWPGWLFYAAVHFNPQNSWWRDFAALNRYVARVQSFLQTGEPDNDVLLYFPVHDRYAERTGELLRHFDGSPAEGSSFRSAAETLLERGYAFDYISDRQMSSLAAKNGRLSTGRGAYQTLVVPGVRYLPLETLEKLMDLARSGATVIAFEGLPEEVPGLGDLAARQARMREVLERLRFRRVPGTALKEARIGEGAVLLGADLGALLERARVRREVLADHGLRFIRRENEDGSTYLVSNPGEAPVESWIPLGVTGRSVAIFDPMLGRSGIARSRSGSAGDLEVYLQIPPGETRVVRTHTEAIDGPLWRYLRPVEEPRDLQGEWTVHFTQGGPEIPQNVRTRQLKSWTAFPGEEVRSFSGTARYTTSFPRPTAAGADAWLIDLGEVHQSARVRLNGHDLGTLIGPRFQVSIADSLLADTNRLEVEVSNLMANRIAHLDRQGRFWRKFYNVNFPARLRENRGEDGLFNAAEWTPRPSGLLGPLTLTPAESFRP